MSENADDYRGAYEGRTGADRMALGLPIIPDEIRGDMDKVKQLMSELKPDTIQSKKPGRPKSVRVTAERLIGIAGVATLEANDLYVVTGAFLRQGNLFLPQGEETNG